METDRHTRAFETHAQCDARSAVPDDHGARGTPHLSVHFLAGSGDPASAPGCQFGVAANVVPRSLDANAQHVERGDGES